MALLKKSAPFVVPSLADAHQPYRDLLQKQAELNGKQAAQAAERRVLEKQIREEPKSEYSARVAALLDEPVDTENAPRRRISEIDREQRDVAAALEVVRRRLLAAKGLASAAVRAHSRRVAALAMALEAVAAARVDYDELVDQFVAEDIEWTGLIPMQPTFLGDRRDGHVVRWLREAKEAGYVQ